MPAGQNEVRVLVFRQGERRRFITIEVMATIARIEIRCARELPSVLIAVAIGAALKFDFENSVFSFRNMTLRAFKFGMPALQRVGGRSMILQSECGRFPSRYSVARGTFGAAGTLGELAIVWVGLMAAGAFLEREWLLKIAAAVTLNAADIRMFPQQRVLRSGVIEKFSDRWCRDFFPTAGVVACLAALGKAAFVWIAMTVAALSKGNSQVPRLVINPGRVTFLAGNLCV